MRTACFLMGFYILTFFNFYIHTKTIDESIKTADELYKIGDFNKFLQLYKRVLFFLSSYNFIFAF